MVGSSMDIQEIWDEILDHVHSRKDLKSSALVCRAFVSRTQMHLFHSITILPHLTTPGTANPSRVVGLLSSSPHLVDYVRDLYMDGCDAEILGRIAQIAWSRLRSITFAQSKYWRGTLPLVSIYHLVSLPTLRKISFHFFNFETLTTDPNFLRTLLGNCRAGICDLRFSACYLPDRETPLVQSDSLRPRITSLHFDDTSIPINYLMDAVDLSCLAHATIGSYSGLGALLRECKYTIKSLELISGRLQKLDLGSLPILSHITLRHFSDGVQRVFRDSSRSNIRTICCYVLWKEWTRVLPTLDSLISVTKMPLLQRVEVQILLVGYHLPFTAEEWRAHAEKLMPTLAERGMLILEFEH
ncbi:hypothetical protein DFH09DRAFT_1189192 [Mycena vulgaris]|nr:hypothetical protein DFH09DRAFT_1189192 [Mycena vulgaris]